MVLLTQNVFTTHCRIISVKAEHLYMGIQVYNLLLSARGGDLKEQTAEMLCIADNLDKVTRPSEIKWHQVKSI